MSKLEEETVEAEVDLKDPSLIFKLPFVDATKPNSKAKYIFLGGILLIMLTVTVLTQLGIVGN
jgi:hypothetical protein